MALHLRWLPGMVATTDTLGTAKWLEDEHWRRMEVAVANGIAHALNG